MVNLRVEKQGRILIPKNIRERFGLRQGERIVVQERGDELVLRIPLSTAAFVSNLKGCVKRSKMKIEEVKGIWRM